jgi:hypothetical protein
MIQRRMFALALHNRFALRPRRFPPQREADAL